MTEDSDSDDDSDSLDRIAAELGTVPVSDGYLDTEHSGDHDGEGFGH